jgi:arsenate reductase
MRARVLFLCTHNSVRSQMAEGFLRHLAGDRFEVASAGIEATGSTMRETGADLSTHTSKTLDSLLDRPWDGVVTVCASANERCPVFPRETTRIHWSFEDPSQGIGTEDQRLETFRRVRHQIRARVEAWLAAPRRHPR